MYYSQALELQAGDIEGSNHFSSNLICYSVQTIGYPACIMTIHYNFMAHVPAMLENLATFPSSAGCCTGPADKLGHLEELRMCENTIVHTEIIGL